MAIEKTTHTHRLSPLLSHEHNIEAMNTSVKVAVDTEVEEIKGKLAEQHGYTRAPPTTAKTLTTKAEG